MEVECVCVCGVDGVGSGIVQVPRSGDNRVVVMVAVMHRTEE